jgi:hypothetical protein
MVYYGEAETASFFVSSSEVTSFDFFPNTLARRIPTHRVPLKEGP